jgi:hypothetical protein
VVSTLDAHRWVRICSYINNFLDQVLLKDKFPIIVYDYAKSMLFFVMEKLCIMHVVCDDFLFYLQAYGCNGTTRIHASYFVAIFLICTMHAIVLILVFVGRVFFSSIMEKSPMRNAIWNPRSWLQVLRLGVISEDPIVTLNHSIQTSHNGRTKQRFDPS